ncbi:hypothetical protein DENIS_1144 [Desulfonema ishimotonii]|uniref:Fimbrial assembly protein n=1 Tax=Desulfonema ishimotonii TaxID=45657 RepID=A0A401FTB1_9BACT|nr:PilN domain-containing protein [Desulfonema ishimotonii]GBC60193.1 hypothetical protein DENIS_1144 [Desulfonema ishimotonii]
MLFQDSVGVDIRRDRVSMALLNGAFRGVRLAAHDVYNLDGDRPIRENLSAVAVRLREFKRENRVGKADIFMGIPEHLVMSREIEFPLAVKENLRATLGYEMEKYIPLPADAVYFDYQITEEDRAGNRLRVLLTVVRRTDLTPYIDLCKTLNGGVSGIEAASTALANCLAYASERRAGAGRKRGIAKPDDAGSDGQDFSGIGLPVPELAPAFGLALRSHWTAPMQVNLFPHEMRKRPGRIGYYVMFGLIALVILGGLAWGGGHVMRQRMAVKDLDTEIKRLSAEVAEIDRLRSRIETAETRIEDLRQLSRGQEPVLDILRELTQLMPENTWIQDFSLSEKGGRINGFAESASELIPLLEGSPLFRDVVFLAAITRNKDGKERFSIGLQTVPPPE